MLPQYIKRCYLFSKAIKKFNLSKFQVFTLYTVYLHDGSSWTVIFKQLIKVNIKPNESFLGDTLRHLVASKYLRKDESNLFYITPTGTASLKDLEKRLRIERHDR